MFVTTTLTLVDTKCLNYVLSPCDMKCMAEYIVEDYPVENTVTAVPTYEGNECECLTLYVEFTGDETAKLLNHDMHDMHDSGFIAEGDNGIITFKHPSGLIEGSCTMDYEVSNGPFLGQGFNMDGLIVSIIILSVIAMNIGVFVIIKRNLQK